MDESCRGAYPTIVTWIQRCANVLYAKYHESERKVVKEPAKKMEKVVDKKVTKKAEVVPVAPKASPTAVFTCLPPTTFELEEWKRKYINSASYPDTMTWLWENIDQEGFSFWHGLYKYSDELAVDFMISNLINGFFERVDKLRKFSFGVMYLAGLPEGGKGNFEISCVWIFRGKSLAFDLNDDWCQDSFLYEFRQLNPQVSEDKHIIEDYFTQKASFRKYPLYDIYLFH
ncbi:hypothetical protein MXB_1698 [Myxobolus squamalis]|nr:hypothetical protein MXB_1698 [Myxobolus squamalis]